jgi:hypothetical protein
MEKPIFDASIPINVKVITPEGIKQIAIRFPTDDEWIARSARRKLVYRNLGRGIQEPVQQEPQEEDAVLLNSLRIEPGTEVDAFEADRILDELGSSQVVNDPRFEDGICQIVLRARGVLTTHSVRMPTGKEGHQIKKFCTPRQNVNREIWSFNLAIIGDLYKKLCQGTTGYVGAVPIVHQLPVVQAAKQALDSALGVGEHEDF